MKKNINLLLFFVTTLFAKDFTVSDPPMLYIYHFVSYDTTSILLHGGAQDESKHKVLRFPLFSKNDVSTAENLVVGKPLDPKLVSAMVTSAVAKNPHINIAGESIQKRIKTDNFINLVKSYEYPKRTDFIFIGEINTLASQYEVDLKLIDVSTQKIIASEFFHLEFGVLHNLRSQINDIVGPLMNKIITPFIGSVYVRVDSTSRERIRWDDISIRPIRSVVGSRNLDTQHSDFSPYQTMLMPSNFLDSHNDILSQFLPSDYRLIKSYENVTTFLAGAYKFQAFLKNNEEPFEIDFIVRAGDLNEIHMSLPYVPPPKDSDGDGIIDEFDACPKVPGLENKDPELNGCPPPKLDGDITILNVWDGVGFEILRINEESDTLIAYGSNKNNQLEVESNPYNYNINLANNSVTIFDLPLGTYLRNSHANTEERFPGKHYVSLFADSDTLRLDRNKKLIKTVIADQDLIKGREVVIYFDPFTPGVDDDYRLFLFDQSLFAVTRIVGELHIVGMPINYDGDIIVKREGYEEARVEIKPNRKKSYHLAELTKPEE